MSDRLAGVVRTVLAVGVIIGWLLTLTWLVLSVSQIAVERTVLRPCAVAGPGDLAC
jgi:uncharacterized membrane protein YciS (DUF1049 family)